MTTPTDQTVQWVEQDVSSKLDYSQTYSNLLTASDTIVTSTWPLVGGLTFTNETISGAVVGVRIEASSAGLYRVTNSVVTSAGRKDSRTFLLYAKTNEPLVKSKLFYRDEFIAKFRSDRLPAVAGFISGSVSDDYLWDKLKAAEADAQRELHVYLVPTVLFPNDPTQAEIDALTGAPWAVDPGYDYTEDMIQPGGWTFIPLRQRPVISLESIKFIYPYGGTVLTVPTQWIKIDKKYGHVRFLPTNAFLGALGGMMIGGMGLQGSPQFIEVRYTAGLQNAVDDYPDLLDLIQRMVLLRLMADAVVSASESISADGLSQSKSAPDLEKMQDGIDKQLESLRQRIHGVPLMVM